MNFTPAWWFSPFLSKESHPSHVSGYFMSVLLAGFNTRLLNLKSPSNADDMYLSPFLKERATRPKNRNTRWTRLTIDDNTKQHGPKHQQHGQRFQGASTMFSHVQPQPSRIPVVFTSEEIGDFG